MHKKIGEYLTVFAAAVGVTLLVCFIIGCQIDRFYRALYINLNLLSTQKIFFTTVRQIAVTIALCASGIACVFLYFSSYEEDEFLRYTRMFFLAAGVVISIWDYEFVFYTSHFQAQIWRVSADICLVLFCICVYNAVLMQFQIPVARLLRTIHETVGGFLVFLLFLSNARQSVYLMRGYLFCLTVYSVVISVSFFQKIKNGKTSWLSKLIDSIFWVISFLVMEGILYLAAFYKFETLTWGYEAYRRWIPIITGIYAVFLFIQFFQYHRTGILLGGNANRKIMEITKHKEAVTQMIIHYCSQPIHNLLFYTKTLAMEGEGSISPEQSTLLVKMQQELLRMKRHLEDIEDFRYLQGERIQANKIKVNPKAIFGYVMETLEKEGVKWSYELQGEEGWNNFYALGDPYLLIQANHTFLSQFYDIRSQESLEICCIPEPKTIRVLIRVWVDTKRLGTVKKIKKILEKPDYIRMLSKEEDIALAMAKNYILDHDKKPKIQIEKQNGNGLVTLSYRLPLWESKVRSGVIQEQEAENQKEEIVLLSTMPEQIEILKSYLKEKNYHTRFFSVEEDAVTYIQSEKGRRIGTIIIGTIFFAAHMDEFCREIRERYTMEQLPILLLCQEKLKNMDGGLLEYVNDIMYDPVEQDAFLQKIQSLLMLQRSAKETMMAKLDFLQAQMDPHFIFNTLSTIMPLCLKEPKKAYELLDHFSEYLRGRLYAKELQTPIPIYEELELIEAYLSIEKVRFPGRIDYRIDVAYQEDATILPLLVEPIVENCVKHGIKGEGILHIYLGIREKKEGLIFEIRDDGKGMSDELLKEINQTDKSKNGSIGIGNVRKRLLIYYNQPLDIKSSLEEGTIVSFQIPMERR